MYLKYCFHGIFPVTDMLLAETAANDRDGKRVTITVFQGSNPDPSRPGLEVRVQIHSYYTIIGSIQTSLKINSTLISIYLKIKCIYLHLNILYKFYLHIIKNNFGNIKDYLLE